MFDTGSADMWIYSKQGCQSSGKCPNRDFYEEGKSTQFKELTNDNNSTTEYTLDYGIGEIKGRVVEDIVCFSSSTESGKKPQKCLKQPV